MRADPGRTIQTVRSGQALRPPTSQDVRQLEALEPRSRPEAAEMLTIHEAYELIRSAAPVTDRLAAVASELESRGDLEREKAWLFDALTRLQAEQASVGEVLASIRALPEMSSAREEYAVSQIGPFVDMLEKLLAGITFHFGSRSPVIEALYPHLRLPNLRRPNLDELRSYWTEFERRLRSSYVERIFAQEDWGFAREVAEQIRAAWAPIAAAGPAASPPTEDERRATVHVAIEKATRLELLIGQARLLAEAALLPFEGMFASSGLAAKPAKRRTPRVDDAVTPSPSTGNDPAAEPASDPTSAHSIAEETTESPSNADELDLNVRQEEASNAAPDAPVAALLETSDDDTLETPPLAEDEPASPVETDPVAETPQVAEAKPRVPSAEQVGARAHSEQRKGKRSQKIVEAQGSAAVEEPKASSKHGNAGKRAKGSARGVGEAEAVDARVDRERPPAATRPRAPGRRKKPSGVTRSSADAS